ncbi:MAG: molybdopterin dinucleotide binding domain-containing protein, partial [Candidatus Bathyarchaeia archaeon]
TGKIELYSTILKEYGFDPLPLFKRPMDPTPEYPLILITGCRVPFYVHSKYREIEKFRRLMPHPVVNINSIDAERRKIKEGDDVIVASPWGKIKVKAHISYMMPPGIVEVLHGWAEANVNELIPRDWDPISGFPPYKECICEVKKAYGL